MPSLFQSISSFFSTTTTSRDHYHIRRDQAMSSIDDAFSVPPDAEYVSSPTMYTYPPPAQAVSYDTVPQSTYSFDQRPSPPAGSSSSTRSRPTPLLPLHHSPISPLPNYPPLQQTWARLRAWLDEQYPELADTLNWGLPRVELAQLELQLSFALPPAVRDSYLLVDGQEAESAAGCSEGLFFGLTLLPFEDVVDEWRFWREVDDDPSTGANPALRESMRSIPPGWIRREYSHRGWLPLVADKAGNYLGVDMNPDERGAIGQVIVFGRDFDTKVVMWRGEGEGGWARWLASFVEELESGEGFELGTADVSEGSEDDVGYESYFFDGTAGKREGGGDNGGGLRLTGEYRGWAVLEALADRSMKRWIEAGVMPQPALRPEAPSNTSELGLEPIIRTSDLPEGKEEVLTPRQANGDPSSLYPQPQTVTITKAPAPLPVQLPTEDDLLPSPTFSTMDTTLVYDEETAVRPMREVDRTTPVQTNFTSPRVKEATLVPLPSNEQSPSRSTSRPEQPRRQPTDSLVTESHALLADPSPIVDTSNASQEAFSSPILTPPVEPLDPLSSGNAEEDEPQPTVRLVGGGGLLGDASLVDTTPGDALDHDKKLASSSRSGQIMTEA